jgi:GNAT superfamily N-acetyltransferase
MQYISSNNQQLNQFYKHNKDKARAKPQDLMYAAINDDGKVCAVLRLLNYDNFLFLRSVLTASEYRGLGIASNLIRHSLDQQSSLIYTLPTPLALPVYQRLGFQTVAKQEIPAQLLASYRRFRQGDDAPRVMVIDSSLG